MPLDAPNRHRPAILRALLAAGLLLSAAVEAHSQAPAVSRREAEYEVVVEPDVMIPMRDGVRLAADLYRPATDGKAAVGKFPALLTRTPYGKHRGGAGEGRYFAARGYVVVVNDTRGRYASEGTWRMMADDPEDGFDVVEWIAAQPWSDGKVGTFGTSYPGGTQHALAELDPPHLSAMVPVDALSNTGVAGMRHGGAFELRFMNWIFNQGASESKAAQANPALQAGLKDAWGHIRDYVDHLPFRPGTTPLRVTPEYEGWLVEALGAGPEDPLWHAKGMSVVDHIGDYADVPVLHLTGWYDSWTRQVTMNYEALSKAKSAPQRLIIGPWVHGSQRSNVSGEVEFTDDAAIDLDALRLRWYDHWLGGIDNGVADDPPVDLYVMGTGPDRKSPEGRLLHGGSWRSRAGMAPQPRRADPALPARRRHPPPRAADRCRIKHDLRLRPGASGPDHRRQHLVQRRLDDQRRLRPAPSPRHPRRRRPAAALGPPRRPGLPLRPAGRGHGGHRNRPGEALGLVRRRRYRLHRQADRRDPAERGLPRRLRPEHRRLDRAGPLPRLARTPRADGTGQALPDHDHALPDLQRLQGRAPDPARRQQQQLSPLRREPEHRRPAQHPTPAGRRRRTRSTTTPGIRPTSSCP